MPKSPHTRDRPDQPARGACRAEERQAREFPGDSGLKGPVEASGWASMIQMPAQAQSHCSSRSLVQRIPRHSDVISPTSSEINQQFVVRLECFGNALALMIATHAQCHRHEVVPCNRRYRHASLVVTCWNRPRRFSVVQYARAATGSAAPKPEVHVQPPWA